MKISRRFTLAGDSPYKGITFESRRAEVRDGSGNVLFSQDNVLVPSFWSQIATDLLAEKYFFRASQIPQAQRPQNFQGENDVRQVFHRMAGCWTDWGKRHGYFDTDVDAKSFYDEVCFLLAHQMASPNSPQWFNTGIYFAYGVEGGAQGHTYVDLATAEVKASENAYEHPQPSACFIQAIRDDLVNADGIMDLWKKEARLFKFGSGSGTNFSALRAVGEPLSGGGQSSGLMSFLKVGDSAAGVIRSGGTTRRAAKMVIVDIDHPEVEDFILWKVREEEKVAALVAGAAVLRSREMLPRLRELLSGLNTHWEGEAYRTVSGQNGNNSVSIPNDFFAALERKEMWKLRWRVSGKIARELSAEKLWDQIGFAAWHSADPGVFFATTINEWHTCPRGGEIRASNPCSEYLFLDDTACNLVSLNMLRFLSVDGDFRIDDFRHSIRLFTIVLEISVLMGQFPSQAIARNSYDYRTVGLGFANLGAFFMALGVPYASPRARAIAAVLTGLLTGEAYAVSSELAKELGSFAKFSENREAMLRVIRNHRRAIERRPREEYEGVRCYPMDWNEDDVPTDWVRAARDSWRRAEEGGEKWGFRNAQVSAIAPTGTIGLVMDCDTLGIEPEFALVKRKSMAGGGVIQIANQTVERALKGLGYDANSVQQMLEHVVKHKTLVGALGLKAEHLPIFDCANGTRAIAPEDHLRMVAAVQPFVTGGVSKTVNLPFDTSVEKVKEIYLLAWKLMLKSISIYRDRSKLSQPMTAGPGDQSVCGPTACD